MKQYEYELRVMYEYYKHQMEHGNYLKEYYKGKMEAIQFVIAHIDIDKPNVDFYIDFLDRIHKSVQIPILPGCTCEESRRIAMFWHNELIITSKNNVSLQQFKDIENAEKSSKEGYFESKSGCPVHSKHYNSINLERDD